MTIDQSNDSSIQNEERLNSIQLQQQLQEEAELDAQKYENIINQLIQKLAFLDQEYYITIGGFVFVREAYEAKFTDEDLALTDEEKQDLREYIDEMSAIKCHMSILVDDFDTVSDRILEAIPERIDDCIFFVESKDSNMPFNEYDEYNVHVSKEKVKTVKTWDTCGFRIEGLEELPINVHVEGEGEVVEETKETN